ncbi:MAG: nitroreductase family protein [Oleiphilaceae bacterium]|nr:nitroreductase family protein [Oleiphilaceae bacterium]
MSTTPDEALIDFSQRDFVEGLDPRFVARWSPRAFEKIELTPVVIKRLIEAARWAPSCFNEQPWRFYTSSAQNFEDYLGLLAEANQSWAKDCAVIGFLVATKTFAKNGKTNAHARFDCGAAWMSLCLQARHEGLYAHGMAGVDFEKATEYLQLDDSEELVMAFAVGKLADLSQLSAEQREKETPNSRKPLDDIWRCR